MRSFGIALVASLWLAAAAQAAPGILRAETETIRENDGSVTVSVLRRHGSTGVITVDYATTSSTAVAGRDFIPVSGTLTFQDGEVSKFVTITLLDNDTYDGNRQFFLTLSNPTGGATIDSYPVGEVHLMDDELPPNVSVNDVRVIEGNSGTKNAEFTITMTSVTRTNDILIFWRTNSFSATAGSDFESGGGSFVFTPADTQKTFSVPVYGDTVIEEDETFNVYLYGGATFTKQYGYCTIVNDDSLLSVVADDVRVTEGNAAAVITLHASQPLSGVSIHYATADGSAVAGRDYQASSGSVTFSGEMEKEITVPLIDDSDVEGDEQFTLHLSASGGSVSVQRSDIEVTIVNDDIGVGPAIQYLAKGTSGSVVVDAGSAPSSPQSIAVVVSDRCIEAPSSVTLAARRVSIPVKALSAPCSAHVDVTLAGKTWRAGIVTYDALTVTFDPPQPRVYVGQKTSVRAIVSPFHGPITLRLDITGGTAVIPSSVEVGANGDTFTIEGLAPGTFGINATLPAQEGGGMSQLFGDVVEARGLMTIAQLSPSSGPASGGTNVTLDGANFGTDCTITFGDARAAAVAFAGGNSLRAATPAHSAGTVDVIATCGDDTFTLPNAFTFTGGRRRAVR